MWSCTLVILPVRTPWSTGWLTEPVACQLMCTLHQSPSGVTSWLIVLSLSLHCYRLSQMSCITSGVASPCCLTDTMPFQLCTWMLWREHCMHGWTSKCCCSQLYWKSLCCHHAVEALFFILSVRKWGLLTLAYLWLMSGFLYMLHCKKKKKKKGTLQKKRETYYAEQVESLCIEHLA